jgi:hypothetical protein
LLDDRPRTVELVRLLRTRTAVRSTTRLVALLRGPEGIARRLAARPTTCGPGSRWSTRHARGILM